MASNELPKALPQLFALAENMADGLHEYEFLLKIKQNTEVVFRADLDAATLAAGDYANAKGWKNTYSTALRIADSNARAFLKAARGVLVDRYGEFWSDAWKATGFPNNSTAVPNTQVERLTLCTSLKNYFINNPSHAVLDAKINVTALIAETRGNALSNARQTVKNGNVTAGNKKIARDVAVKILLVRMRGLIGELSQLLKDNDPCWEAFGLNQPGAPSAPEAPEALTLTSGSPGTAHADWADSRRADRYRVWLNVVGNSSVFQSVATVHDSDATLFSLGSGKTVRIYITAVNETGESQPSAIAELGVA